MIVNLKQNYQNGAICYTKISVRTLNELQKALKERKIYEVKFINLGTILENIEFIPVLIEEINTNHLEWLKENQNETKFIEIKSKQNNLSLNIYRRIS